MLIVVKMSPEEYDSFRTYQKDRAALEKEIEADYRNLHEKHKMLCSTILAGFETEEVKLYSDESSDPVEVIPDIKIKDVNSAWLAIESANDWFC